MRHFCTLFDRNYITRGLALHRSLIRHGGEFTLHVLCLDEPTLIALSALGLPGMDLIPIEALESWDHDLYGARSGRTLPEFYFTCKPVLLGYVLDRNPAATRLSYLDADLYFFSDPVAVEREFADSPVALSPHRFEARHASLRRHGKFNAGWVSVSGSQEGRRFVGWWRDRCIEWCRLVVEDLRFGDQKYLDQVPTLFPRTAIVLHPGVNLAPWNIGACRIEMLERGVEIEGRSLVFFHFHGTKRMLFNLYESGLYEYGVDLTAAIRNGIYRPYVAELAACDLLLSGLPATARSRLKPARDTLGAGDLVRKVALTARAVARHTAVFAAA